MIRNPVLPGHHPDPSFLRVGDDYYIATSTCEWTPGVRLHHSRDLETWRSLGGALLDLDLTGYPDSGGVWAPSLSYADGEFHLLYSMVSSYAGGFTDSPNYVVTAPTIEGPWSAPVLVHARGFDASLFHDGDDSWVINLEHDWRPGHGGSAGLEATRYDRFTRQPFGEPVRLRLPPRAGWIEGPNLYRRGDWYYLLTADGGTSWEHRVTVLRARSLAGPYERDPNGPLVTARHDPDLPLQKAGHGSLVQTPDGRWLLAYLVARPHGRHGPCVLGRETALAEVRWTADGWPVVPGGVPTTSGFPDQDIPGPQWQTLRRPATDGWIDIGDTITIRGGRSPQSLIEPSLLARRLTAPRCSFEATVDFKPTGFQHLAGITVYYNTRNWHFLYLTGGGELRLATRDHGELTIHDHTIKTDATVRLGADLDGPSLTFRHLTGDGWQRFGPVLDATVVSDEHAREGDTMGFTGAFAGLWVWDLTGAGHSAEFSDVAYRIGPSD
ncbi:family 43 glycosylhydrolase [Actinoplanes sp. NPDC049802]|uniref:family 43 glycosylhydrolase n=1 Tax=Actinoplanes sp. NPDC049802 TaxID=3154742 RepID=UPI00340B1659